MLIYRWFMIVADMDAVMTEAATPYTANTQQRQTAETKGQETDRAGQDRRDKSVFILHDSL